MTENEWNELVDLYVADELPDTLRTHVESRLTARPDAARDAASLRDTLTQLRTAPTERPDSWFTERLLDTLLREHAAAYPVTLSLHTNHPKENR